MTIIEKSAPPFPVPIGGFFALDETGTGGLADLWQIDPGLAWENASSAFAALIAQIKPTAVWMPGFLCNHMAQAVPQSLRRYFRLTNEMEPDTATMTAVAAGDLVLAVNYFGRCPGPSWREFVASRPDVFFIEDCAQSFDTGQSAWGDWRLYSPRKILGVPEGGLLVPHSVRARQMAVRGPTDPSDPDLALQRLTPMKLRREQPRNNVLWHPLHQRSEANGKVSNRAMAPDALAVLCSVDPVPIAARRKANFDYLKDRLGPFGLIQRPDTSFVPFGFPIALPANDRGHVLTKMYQETVFAAIHWRDIAAPAPFAFEHSLSASTATLPCDQRYDTADMERICATFLGALT